MFSALIRANQGILQQKIGLIESLIAKHGYDQAKIIYGQSCPIAKASIGQHVRHSMDHIERVAVAAQNPDQSRIHYDLRERGGADENDITKAQARIQDVLQIFAKLPQQQEHQQQEENHRPIGACFMHSGDASTEFTLPSTISRELGFSAHHAIHHMAMVKIIATTSGGLTADDMADDFGMAPSTVNFEKNDNQ